MLEALSCTTMSGALIVGPGMSSSFMSSCEGRFASTGLLLDIATRLMAARATSTLRKEGHIFCLSVLYSCFVQARGSCLSSFGISVSGGGGWYEPRSASV
jgi:hypothetical protein